MIEKKKGGGGVDDIACNFDIDPILNKKWGVGLSMRLTVVKNKVIKSMRQKSAQRAWTPGRFLYYF